MNKELIQKAILHRKHSGSFISLQDFMDRISISPDQLELLIRVGAFDFTGINKRELLWQMTLLGKPGTKNQSQFVLFKRKPKTFTLPDLYIHSKEHAFDQMELLGFSLTSPFTLIDPLILKNHLCVKDLPQYENQEIEILGHFVNSKKTQTVNHLAMHFGTFLDQDGQWIDTVHFPEIAKQYPFRGKGIYRIKGKVIHEFGFLSIEVREFEKIPFIEDPRYALPS